MEQQNSKQEILLHVHEIQHQVSLAHLNAIFSAFSLTLTGLLVLAAAVVTLGRISLNLKFPLVLVVVVVWLVMTYLIRDQRQASERAIRIARAIDTELGLFQNDKYLAGKSVLPDEYSKPQQTLKGFSRRVDLPLVFALGVLSLGLILVICLLPTLPLCP